MPHRESESGEHDHRHSTKIPDGKEKGGVPEKAEDEKEREKAHGKKTEIQKKNTVPVESKNNNRNDSKKEE